MNINNVINLSYTRLQQYRIHIFLIFLLLAAFGLRMWGIGFGLPNLYHPDEDAVVMPAVNIIKTGDLEPTRMEYGTLHIYALTAVSALTFIQSTRNGYIESPDQLTSFERGSYPAVYAHPEYFLTARILSAILGAGIVLIVYMLSERLGNRRQALIAATLATVLPALTLRGHFATTDTALTFLGVLSLYLIIRVYDNWEQDNFWAYAGAGLVCGLTVSTKYNGAVLAVPLLLVPLLKSRRLDDLLSMRTLAGPISMGIGFIMGTPYAILNLPKFLYWIGYALRLYNSSGQSAITTSWQWHLTYHIGSPNAPVFFLGLAGLLLSWHHWKWKRATLVNSFALFLWLAIITQTRREARMWLPTAPIFIAWTALLMDIIISYLQQRLSVNWIKKSVPIVIISLVVVPLSWQSISMSWRFTQDDVRTHAQQWIEENIPYGSQIAVDYFGPNLDTAIWPVTKRNTLHDIPTTWFQEQEIQYIVLSEAITTPSDMKEVNLAKYNELIGQSCLLQTITGPFISNPNFHMWIYQIPPC